MGSTRGWLALALTLLAGGAAGGATAQPSATLDVGSRRLLLPVEADRPLVTYDRLDGRAAEAVPLPRLRVYADGRVLVHQPFYRVDAGDWELRLSPAELQALLRQLVAAGVLDFEPARVVAAKAQAMSRQREGGRRVHVVADGPVLALSLDLGMAQDGAGRVTGPARRDIVWANVHDEASRYPELTALRGLAEADRLLYALSERPDKRRLAASPASHVGSGPVGGEEQQ